MSEAKTASSPAPKENRMGTEPVNSLLLKLAVPMVISMLAQALYNVVDSVFVSRVSEEALSAVSLAFPVQNLIIAFAVGTGVGVNALLSKSLGEKNQAVVDKSAMNGIFLALATYLAFLAFGLFGVRWFFHMQTSDAAIFQYGCDYLGVVCLLSVGCFLQCMMEKLLTATGKSVYAMATQMAGALTNIILDPIMIFGLFGFPRLEATGAALATVCGQMVGFGLGLFLNLRVNREVRFRLKGFRPEAAVIARIYSVAFPSIAMQAIGSIMTFAMNTILMAFSATAVAVFGVYFKLQSFVFMPVFGLNNGMVPIVSYNYGARCPARLTAAVRYGVVYAESIMAAGFLAFQLFARPLLLLFDASPDMLAIGIPALRIVSVHFLLAGYDVIASASFQALGKGFYSLASAIGRQLVVLVPVAWLLSLSGEIRLIWWSFSIAELVSFAMCTYFLLRVSRTVVAPLAEKQAAR